MTTIASIPPQITLPPPGKVKTICPKCSHTRRKKFERCLRVTPAEVGFNVSCYHCGYQDWIDE